jgi:hypothetical protein
MFVPGPVSSHAALLPKRDFSPPLFVPNCGRNDGDARRARASLRIGAHWQAFGLKKQARSRTIPHIGRAPLGRCSKREGFAHCAVRCGARSERPLFRRASAARSFPAANIGGAGGAFARGCQQSREPMSKSFVQGDPVSFFQLKEMAKLEEDRKARPNRT